MATQIEKELAKQGVRLAKARENLDDTLVDVRAFAGQAYTEGVPLTSIGATLGVTVKTLYKWFTEDGLYTRPAK